ncbi:MAG: hypothetical protein KC900_14825 [Candidatus Omnitrophica bacterium]|nr:hypothetical protein [Candidatus Omnitrophota bacterium]
MTFLYTFLVILTSWLVLSHTRWIWLINQARKKGIYPEKGKATMFDVRSLIIEGEYDLAIELYRRLFKTSRRNARKAVEDLADSISQKNIEYE